MWRLDEGGIAKYFLKVQQQPSDLRKEGVRFRWAQGRLPVPTVVDAGTEKDVDWLLTEALEGTDVFALRSRADGDALAAVMAEGLKVLHAIPVEDCPFDATAGPLLPRVLRGLSALDPEGPVSAHPGWSPGAAIDYLRTRRPDNEHVVVAHGDYCAPNILVNQGRFSGVVDVANLGVADRWLDLAVGCWTIAMNIGPAHVRTFLETYGAEWDEGRATYYRLLYEYSDSV